MFVEFLQGELFQAKSMVTFEKDWLKVDRNDSQYIINERIKEAEMRDITNLVIVDDGKILGYARVDDVKSSCREYKIYHMEDWFLESSCLLPDIAKRFCRDGVDKYSLYFVGESIHKPVGIMTYADTNRKVSYIYTYTLVLFLEQWLKKKIIEKFGRPDRSIDNSWIESLRNHENYVIVNGKCERVNRTDLLLKKSNGVNPLAYAGLDDLIDVFRNQPAFKEEPWRQSEVLHYVREFRTRVAHPVKLLVSKKNAAEDIRILKEFWENMLSLVKENDFNEKNGGWPVEVS